MATAYSQTMVLRVEDGPTADAEYAALRDYVAPMLAPADGKLDAYTVEWDDKARTLTLMHAGTRLEPWTKEPG